MDKKSNVIPFFRFPDPKTMKCDPQAMLDLDIALEKAFNNPALKQFDKTLTQVANEAMAYDEVMFRSSSVTVQELEFYAPNPIPEYCYHTEVHFKKWILDFQFFGAGDATARDIASGQMTHYVQGPHSTVEAKGVELDFLQRLWVKANEYAYIDSALRTEDAHIASFQFTRFDHTRVEVFIRPVEEK